MYFKSRNFRQKKNRQMFGINSRKLAEIKDYRDIKFREAEKKILEIILFQDKL